MRVEGGKTLHNGGWFHAFKDVGGGGGCKWSPQRGIQPKNKVDPSPPTPAFDVILSGWRASSNGEMDGLSVSLGVDKQALLDLGGCYAHEYHAFAFPMSDASTKIVGIRLRSDNRKWAVRGSKSALFIPYGALGRLSARTVLICEGPTDTSAALTLGFFAIGRPACLGCEEMVAEVLAELGTSDAIICYDNDNPGVLGAERLAHTLPMRVTRFVPPCKDLRAFVAAGGTKEVLISMVSNTLRTFESQKKKYCYP